MQKHDTSSGTHWDFMLEGDGVLLTWRLEKAPEHIEDGCYAVRIGDHDMRFLSYQGPVQNNTGTVSIADEGAFSISGSCSEWIGFVFSGKKLGGSYILRHIEKDLWNLHRPGAINDEITSETA